MQSSPVGNERNKTKKKGGILKKKRNGETITNDEDGDGNDVSIALDEMDGKRKLERLEELQNKFVGGEEANNEERKKKRKKKLNEMQELQERRKRFNKIINAEDDDTMFRVFNSAQEEVSH